MHRNTIAGYLLIVFSWLTCISSLTFLTSCSDSDEPRTDDPTPAPTGVNGWMRSYMQSHYLWNQPIASLKIKNSLSAEDYLLAMLDGVDAQGHLNREDGHWVDGKREYYYSWVDVTDGRSRAGETASGSGIMNLTAARMTESGNEVGLIATLVCPKSPADELGLTRGCLITAINGTTITTGNYQSMADKLINGNVNITWHTVTFDNQGKLSINDRGDAKLPSATFNNVSVYISKILEVNSKKVGYLLYTSFDYGYDEQLIKAFTEFKNHGISDLIIDLRYNGGGHVMSSLVLGTLVAGTQHKGQIFGRTTYNAQRSKTTKPGEYRFGVPSIPEKPKGYDKITEALNLCVDLNTVYIICSEYTASASELIINGLRGVDVTVNLIGTTTNGKNCGMEGIEQTFNGVTYDFYPITFYIENAKGFKEYSDGFTPDIIYDDSADYPADFGTAYDTYTYLALYWINFNEKPVLTHARADAAHKITPLHIDRNPSGRHIRGAIVPPGS